MKRLFIFIAAIFAAAVSFGQTPLPNDPAVRVGKLENGMIKPSSLENRTEGRCFTEVLRILLVKNSEN